MAMARPSHIRQLVMPPRRSSKKSSQRLREAIQEKSRAKLIVPFFGDDAPIGTYHIDGLADELLAFGFTPSDRAKFIVTIRNEIYLAARFAVLEYQNHKVGMPLRFRRIKRFFKDTVLIEKLIRRNEGLDTLDFMVATTRVGRRSRTGKEREDLLVALSTAAEAIQEFQDNHRPMGRPGNRDPLAQQFIDEVLYVWCEHLSIGGSPDEDKLFVRYLSAAWRDVQFPTKEHKGQRLQDWLADRVRKHFREGVSAARLRHQSNDELYYDWIYSRSLNSQKKSTK